MEWLGVLTLTTVQGALTLGGVGLGAFLTARLGRSAAYLEHNLSKRHDAYLLLADFCVRLRAAALMPGVEESEQLLASLVDDDRTWWALQANARVYGTDDVRAQFDKLLALRVQLATALVTWRQVRDLSGPPDEASKGTLQAVRARRQETAARCETFLSVLNTELRASSE